jgi:uncharacterized membrane protein
MPLVRWAGPLLLVLGALALAVAVAQGSARLFLLLVIPVVTGTGGLFLGGVVLIALGVFFLPLALLSDQPGAPEPGTSAPPPPPLAAERPATEGGGLLLIGPVPIFFGSWRRNPPIRYRWAVAVGLVLVALAVLWFLLAAGV